MSLRVLSTTTMPAIPGVSARTVKKDPPKDLARINKAIKTIREPLQQLALPTIPSSRTSSPSSSPGSAPGSTPGPSASQMALPVIISRPQAPTAAAALRIPGAVKRTFQSLPNALGRTLTDKQMEDMHTSFRLRTSFVTAPTARDHEITGLARTVLMAPGGLGFALMDRITEGDTTIGFGASKQVFHGVGLHDGEHYAIGVCDIAQAALSQQKSEGTIRLSLQREAGFATHLAGVPRIVQTPVAFEENGKFYFVMKFYEGGELFDLQTKLMNGSVVQPLEKRVTLCREILEAIAGAQNRGLIHRDLKAENFLLDARGHPFLCDFGLSTRHDDASELGINTPVGTSTYLAPEILQNKPATQKFDTWSTGVLFHHLLGLRALPWENVPDVQVFARVPRKKSWQPALNFTLAKQDAEIKQLLLDMLKVDPADRISIHQALERIKAIEAALKPKPPQPTAYRKTFRLIPRDSKPQAKPRQALITIPQTASPISERTGGGAGSKASQTVVATG